MVDLSIKEVVFDLLERFSHLRDSDEKLVANIWHNRIKHLGGIDAHFFLQMYADGRLPSSESITRCRRKIQEENPDLRGKLYAERQAKQEDIKADLGYETQSAGIKETQLHISW